MIMFKELFSKLSNRLKKEFLESQICKSITESYKNKKVSLKDKEDLESSRCLEMINELVSNEEKYKTCNLILSTDFLDGLNHNLFDNFINI